MSKNEQTIMDRTKDIMQIINEYPVRYSEHRGWIVNTDEGLKIYYKFSDYKTYKGLIRTCRLFKIKTENDKDFQNIMSELKSLDIVYYSPDNKREILVEID